MLDRLNNAIELELLSVEICVREYEKDKDFWYYNMIEKHFSSVMNLLYVRDGTIHRKQ